MLPIVRRCPVGYVKQNYCTIVPCHQYSDFTTLKMNTVDVITQQLQRYNNNDTLEDLLQKLEVSHAPSIEDHT